MPRRSSNSKTDRKKKGHPFLQWCFQPKRLVIASILSVTALFWSHLSERLPRLDARSEYLVETEQISVSPPPAWVPEGIVSDALNRAELRQPLSLLDPSLNERLAFAFHNHPWIEEVRQVSKSFPTKVHVDVTYRTPVASVRCDEGDFPIDGSGVLLPGNDFHVDDLRRYPIIEGITSFPETGQGRRWDDPAVIGAAQLAALLAESRADGESLWQQFKLRAIEAPGQLEDSEDPAELQFVLRTVGGTRVLWGRSPETQHPGEVAASTKVQKLLDYCRVQGSLDDAPVPYAIDVRPWKGIHRRKLSSIGIPMAEGDAARRH